MCLLPSSRKMWRPSGSHWAMSLIFSMVWYYTNAIDFMLDRHSQFTAGQEGPPTYSRPGQYQEDTAKDEKRRQWVFLFVILLIMNLSLKVWRCLLIHSSFYCSCSWPSYFQPFLLQRKPVCFAIHWNFRTLKRQAKKVWWVQISALWFRSMGYEMHRRQIKGGGGGEEETG